MRLAFVDDDYGEIKKLTTMIDKELHGTVYSSCTKQLFSTGETFLSVWKPGPAGNHTAESHFAVAMSIYLSLSLSGFWCSLDSSL